LIVTTCVVVSVASSVWVEVLFAAALLAPELSHHSEVPMS
jgi:hypothetical protein